MGHPHFKDLPQEEDRKTPPLLEFGRIDWALSSRREPGFG